MKPIVEHHSPFAAREDVQSSKQRKEQQDQTDDLETKSRLFRVVLVESDVLWQIMVFWSIHRFRTDQTCEQGWCLEDHLHVIVGCKNM